METHSSILAWRIPWTEKPGGLQSWGCKESDATFTFTFLAFFVPKTGFPCPSVGQLFYSLLGRELLAQVCWVVILMSLDTSRDGEFISSCRLISPHWLLC